MRIQIKKIVDPGVLDKERLVLEVRGRTDIGRYAVFDTKSSEDGGVSNELERAYWFPDKPVSGGDAVILYTKSGVPKQKRNPDGSKSYFFYWGLDHPIWDEPGHFAVLVLVKSWKAEKTA